MREPKAGWVVSCLGAIVALGVGGAASFSLLVAIGLMATGVAAGGSVIWVIAAAPLAIAVAFSVWLFLPAKDEKA